MYDEDSSTLDALLTAVREALTESRGTTQLVVCYEVLGHIKGRYRAIGLTEDRRALLVQGFAVKNNVLAHSDGRIAERRIALRLTGNRLVALGNGIFVDDAARMLDDIRSRLTPEQQAFLSLLGQAVLNAPEPEPEPEPEVPRAPRPKPLYKGGSRTPLPDFDDPTPGLRYRMFSWLKPGNKHNQYPHESKAKNCNGLTFREWCEASGLQTHDEKDLYPQEYGPRLAWLQGKAPVKFVGFGKGWSTQYNHKPSRLVIAITEGKGRRLDIGYNIHRCRYGTTFQLMDIIDQVVDELRPYEEDCG